MSKTVPGNVLRERLLKRLSDARQLPSDGWVQALAVPGNRDLLALIILHKPQSINELSELAGRAQSNVSRSLTALVNAGLVEIKSEGRMSNPTVTDLGHKKAADVGLTVQPAEQASASNQADRSDPPFLSVSFADGSSDGDRIAGDLVAMIVSREHAEPTVAKVSGDLNATVNVILDHWWRVLYQRDAPYKVGEFDVTDASSARRVSIAIKSTGNHVERIVRWVGERSSLLDIFPQVVPLGEFERDLINGVVRPVVRCMGKRRRYDRPIQAKFSRLEDTYRQKKELAFARTAGALGSSPYDLNDDDAKAIRNLIDMLPDEEARLDFASAVLTDDIDDAATWVKSQCAEHGDSNTLPGLRSIVESLQPIHGVRPHHRGTAAAQSLRNCLHLGSDKAIAGANELAAMFGAKAFQVSPRAPGGLRAFQSLSKDAPMIVVEDETPIGTKLTLARAIGDFLAFRNNASCVANLYTDRQALGRAFAAEFIAPAEGVVKMIDEDDKPISRIARHYGAPESVIRHQYENNYWRYTEA
jgi:DNA-binding transcriptional ArsR family regulator